METKVLNAKNRLKRYRQNKLRRKKEIEKQKRNNNNRKNEIWYKAGIIIVVPIAAVLKVLSKITNPEDEKEVGNKINNQKIDDKVINNDNQTINNNYKQEPQANDILENVATKDDLPTLDNQNIEPQKTMELEPEKKLTKEINNQNQNVYNNDNSNINNTTTNNDNRSYNNDNITNNYNNNLQNHNHEHNHQHQHDHSHEHNHNHNHNHNYRQEPRNNEQPRYRQPTPEIPRPEVPRPSPIPEEHQELPTGKKPEVFIPEKKETQREKREKIEIPIEVPPKKTDIPKRPQLPDNTLNEQKDILLDIKDNQNKLNEYKEQLRININPIKGLAIVLKTMMNKAKKEMNHPRNLLNNQLSKTITNVKIANDLKTMKGALEQKQPSKLQQLPIVPPSQLPQVNKNIAKNSLKDIESMKSQILSQLGNTPEAMNLLDELEDLETYLNNLVNEQTLSNGRSM